MWGHQPSNGRYEKARRAIVKKHVPNPTGWLDYKDVEQEMILHLATEPRTYGNRQGKHRIEQYTGSPTLKALRKGKRRAQIMSFVRPVMERKVRDLVERDLRHQPKTELLVTEGDDGAIPNDPGVVYDLAETMDATARMTVTLNRTGGKEWLSSALGYGDRLNSTERQRLSRFRNRLSEAEHRQLRGDLAVWLLNGSGSIAR